MFVCDANPRQYRTRCSLVSTNRALVFESANRENKSNIRAAELGAVRKRETTPPSKYTATLIRTLLDSLGSFFKRETSENLLTVTPIRQHLPGTSSTRIDRGEGIFTPGVRMYGRLSDGSRGWGCRCRPTSRVFRQRFHKLDSLPSWWGTTFRRLPSRSALTRIVLVLF